MDYIFHFSSEHVVDTHCKFTHIKCFRVNNLKLSIIEPRHVISNNVAFDKCRLRRACAASLGLELAIDPPPPPGGILYTMIF